MTARGGIYGGMHGDGKPVDTPGEVTRQSCGCIHCDLGKKQFNQDGRIIHYTDMMRNLITPCTKPLT